MWKLCVGTNDKYLRTDNEKKAKMFQLSSRVFVI